ncbi:probable leucine-rich repeat receptor-like serine/threonine-protein kinase At3g14840 [Tripterygium wilfordii]|uniref:probable leucine-rich repeat receptor-like serine/threonine-protein kinase At3g14840 n=1 Tax=Tripterygium wilfordii TaxID=458696 RepID=UPI0018F7F470|nr:probable leucine-rich repeat receptor-like serine/threonine-protein kinase At3g14840 [Tripterygium wilfordii]
MHPPPDISSSFCETSRTGSVNLHIRCVCGNDQICHITEITWTGLDLQGSLHEALSGLPLLQKLDMSDNDLHGTIPDIWGKLPHLQYLDLSDNQLIGPIPPSLGNLKNLSLLDLSSNLLSGTIPPQLGSISNLSVLVLGLNQLVESIPNELGNLRNVHFMDLSENLLAGQLPDGFRNLKSIRNLWLSGNFLNGTLPESYANLTTLEYFEVSGNNLSGPIPEYIANNWVNLTHLDLLGNEFEGPLPAKIFSMKTLVSLWVSDLKNAGFSLPEDATLDNMGLLMIRNSSVNGTIPRWLGSMEDLYYLDLSFNNLSGVLPNTLSNRSIEKIFLMHNQLNGTIPKWIEHTIKVKGDLSYNNFLNVTGLSNPKTPLGKKIKIEPLNRESLKERMKSKCPKPKYNSLFINCGGPETTFQGKHYEADNSTDNFYTSPNGNWAYSFSGEFSSGTRDYIENLSCAISVPEAHIYEDSRIAPVSLTYYALCLHNGLYNVTLHFAENVYTKSEDHSILGKRTFDVYIQGDRKLRDYRPKKSLNYTKSRKANFSVSVDDNLLEIHLFWAGKGSIYNPPYLNGPLISAISVIPEFKTKQSPLKIGGIAAASLFVLLVIFLIIWLMVWRRDRELSAKRINIEGRYFSIKEIKKATSNFSQEMQIGSGDSAKVYKAQLTDEIVVAVKKLSPRTKEAIRFSQEDINTLKSFEHENVVKFYGAYSKKDLHLIIYEYMERGSLQDVLFDSSFTWKEQYIICLGTAEGLKYLHEKTPYHGKVKDSQILLAGTSDDSTFKVKISDFWLTNLSRMEDIFMVEVPEEKKYSRVPPEVATLRKTITSKVDVYNYGLVLLEIISRKRLEYEENAQSVYLVSLAYELQEKQRLDHLIDRTPEGLNMKQAKIILELAMVCIRQVPTLRPTMPDVVTVLKGERSVEQIKKAIIGST